MDQNKVKEIHAFLEGDQDKVEAVKKWVQKGCEITKRCLSPQYLSGVGGPPCTR